MSYYFHSHMTTEPFIVHQSVSDYKYPTVLVFVHFLSTYKVILLCSAHTYTVINTLSH